MTYRKGCAIFSQDLTENSDRRLNAYRAAFDKAVGRLGHNGLVRSFRSGAPPSLARTAPASEMCARSPEELRVANIKVILVVQQTGGTFMPFPAIS